MSTTVLELVQGILSKIDSDEVNSISDTTESMQVADLVRDTYDYIVDEFDLQAVKSLFKLDSNLATPTVMTVPEGYHSLEWVRYNASDTGVALQFNLIHPLTPDMFVDHLAQNKSTDANVVAVTADNGVELYCKSDRAPSYWTSFDGVNIMFDSFNLTVESNLLSEKTNCYGQHSPVLVLDDSTPIPLPARFINLLRAETLAMAQDLWKNGVTPKVEQRASRQRARAQRLRSLDRRLLHPDLPNYGRPRSH